MDSSVTSAPNVKRRRRKKRKKAKEQTVLSIISVRLSDEEKERIDEIMRLGEFRHYSDMMRMAITMYRGPNSDVSSRPEIFH